MLGVKGWAVGVFVWNVIFRPAGDLSQGSVGLIEICVTNVWRVRCFEHLRVSLTLSLTNQLLIDVVPLDSVQRAPDATVQ